MKSCFGQRSFLEGIPVVETNYTPPGHEQLLKKNAHRGSKKHLYFAVLSVAYHMDDSNNSGTPKWMLYNGKPY